MRIVVDAMGGDYAPKNIIAGVVDAVKEFPVTIVLVGIESRIKAELAGHSYPKEKIEIVHAPDVVGMDDHATDVIRKKPDCSISVGVNLLKRPGYDAFISAGNTGACVAASSFFFCASACRCSAAVLAACCLASAAAAASSFFFWALACRCSAAALAACSADLLDEMDNSSMVAEVSLAAAACWLAVRSCWVMVAAISVEIEDMAFMTSLTGRRKLRFISNKTRIPIVSDKRVPPTMDTDEIP